MSLQLNQFFKRIYFTVERIILKVTGKWTFPGYEEYWERRYASGKTSGKGSYGELALFKAEIINAFIMDRKIESIIELGCGDGNQLSLFNIQKYTGLDIAPSAIKKCKERFNDDQSKEFYLYDPDQFDVLNIKADLALSLDVIYHLVDENVYHLYLTHLFLSANRFVMIYSSNIDSGQKFHVRQRHFSYWIDENLKNWKLVQTIKNR